MSRTRKRFETKIKAKLKWVKTIKIVTLEASMKLNIFLNHTSSQIG